MTQFYYVEMIKTPVTIPQTVERVGEEMQQGFNGFYNTILNNWLNSLRR